jgi:hypothetical protein
LKESLSVFTLDLQDHNGSLFCQAHHSQSGAKQPFEREVKKKSNKIPGRLPDRDSAFLEVILEFRNADEVEVEDRSRKQDRGACLDGILSEKTSLTDFAERLRF